MKFLIIPFSVFLFAIEVYCIPRTFKGIDLRYNKNTQVDLETKKNMVAYFLSSSCPCSQAHFDHLNKLQKRYPQFSFIGFHSSKFISNESAHNYFKKFNIEFPILSDKDLHYANLFKAVKTPHVFVFDNNDTLVFQGGATNSRNPKRAKHFYLQDALTQISNNQPIKIKNAKTIGCYIQR